MRKAEISVCSSVKARFSWERNDEGEDLTKSLLPVKVE